MAAPITIRKVRDINDNIDQIETLAKRSAHVIAATIDTYSWEPSDELLWFLMDCMSDAMIDERATGEAVDTADKRFRSVMAAEIDDWHRDLSGRWHVNVMKLQEVA